MSEPKLGAGAKSILLLAAAVVVLAAMKLAAPMLVPILVAACISAAMMPIVTLLRRRGVRTYLAVTITTLAVLVGLVAFAWLVALALGDLSDSLPRLEAALASAKRNVMQWLREQRLWSFTSPVSTFSPAETSADLITAVLLGVPSVVSALGVIFFVAVFILLEGASFNTKVHRALAWAPERIAVMQQTISEIQRYLLFKGALSMLTGAACGLWSAAIGQPYAIVWGLLTFLLRFIPAFGGVVITTAASVVALVQMGMGPALLILGGYTVLHTIIGSVVEPKVIGRAAGLSPLVVMVSVVVWAWVLGPIGALLAVPITMIMKIVLAHTEDLRWLAVLLGPGEGKQEQAYVEERRRSRATGSGVAAAARAITGSGQNAAAPPH